MKWSRMINVDSPSSNTAYNFSVYNFQMPKRKRRKSCRRRPKSIQTGHKLI